MAINDQLYGFFESNGLLNKNQHGFMKNKSTVTAIQQLRDYWSKNLERGKLCSALLLDLQAGFDVINVKLLCEKLKVYGFDLNASAWFKDYLTDRSQCVQIDAKISSLLEVPWGVPQGSQISPILFTIFIMELPDVVATTSTESLSDQEEDSETIEDKVAKEEEKGEPTIVIYADDNTPSCAADNIEDLEKKTEALANKCMDWFHRNDMIISSENTNFLVIGSNLNRKQKIPANYTPTIKMENDETLLIPVKNF